MSDSNKILGIGWEFPPRFDKNLNGPTMLEGEADIENSIYVIIHTKIGERLFRNQFGSNVHKLLFEPLNENMKTYMTDSLKRSLATGEPRIEVLSIKLNQPNLGEGKVNISVVYRIIKANVTKNLVVPFYTPNNIHLS
ncbi:MAG: GPW/gp25 family protein [Crocinitomicaceae bacterium]|nr:GPW/gp25 family protein [Crocinitomicaceae bacterium]